MKQRFTFVLAAAALFAAVVVPSGQAPNNDRLNAATFEGLELRNIGPSLVTGRIADLDVDPKNSSVYYVATAAGGLWKSVNRGITFTSVFDRGGSFNLCCVKVDPKDSNIVWLGTGENSNPRSSMIGDGLYKSTDAGATWNRVALEKSEHIGNIVIDPRDSNGAAALASSLAAVLRAASSSRRTRARRGRSSRPGCRLATWGASTSRWMRRCGLTRRWSTRSWR